MGENYFYICIFTASSDNLSVSQVTFLIPGDADERHLQQAIDPYQLCFTVHYQICGMGLYNSRKWEMMQQYAPCIIKKLDTFLVLTISSC